jgi:cyclase
MPDGFSARHRDFECLADGVVAGISRPDGSAICNAGLVDLGTGRAAFDAGMTPAAAQELREASGRALGGPATLLVTSHFHLDHALGNGGFEGVPIWGTSRTRSLILERLPSLDAELQREGLEREIERLEGRRAGRLTDDLRSDLEFTLQLLGAALEASGSARLVPPDRTFDTHLDLPGPRGGQLLSFGPGHTDGDAVLFLPHERILFAGDLVTFGVQPSLGSGDPERWIDVLDRLAALRPERIVPGHGPVAGPDVLAETQAYLQGVLEAARSAPGAALPSAIRRWEGSLTLEENLVYVRARTPGPDAG